MLEKSANMADCDARARELSSIAIADPLIAALPASQTWLSCGAAPATGHGSDLAALAAPAALLRLPRALRLLRVSTGGRHSFALAREHDEGACADRGIFGSDSATALFGFGANDLGQLGVDADGAADGVPARVPLPAPLQRLGVRSVACGWQHTLVVAGGAGAGAGAGDDADFGSLWACGDGADGRLGVGPLAAQGAVRALRRVLFPQGTAPVVAAAAGARHSVAVTADGRVFSWGRNARDCALGRPLDSPASVDVPALVPFAELLADAVAVAAGFAHCAVLTNSGNIVTWGSNRYGQCGRVNEGADQLKNMRLSATARPLPPGRVAGLPPCSAVACGWNRTLALPQYVAGEASSGPGTVFVWGRDDLLAAPAAVAGGASAGAASSPATAHLWAPTVVSLACASGRADDSSRPRSVPSAVSIACGAESCHCVLACGCLFSWGWAEHGNLAAGEGDTRDRERGAPAAVPCHGGGATAAEVVAAGAATFVRTQAAASE